LKKILREFQKIGAAHLANHAHALLADEPGLGKTIQAISASQAVGATSNLVTCPASVRSHWKQELYETIGTTEGWDIISYNQAQETSKLAHKSKRWDVIILDEAHYLKNMGAQRTQAIFGNDQGLARKATFKWCLTGTPVLNRPRELYPMLKTLASDHIAPYTSFNKFAQQWCGAFFDGYGLNSRGASNLEDLKRRLKGFMLRRTKKEVLKELPAKIITRVPLELSVQDMNAIRREEQEISNREALLSPASEEFAQLGDMAKLLRVTGEAKIDAVSKFCNELLETVVRP